MININTSKTIKIDKNRQIHSRRHGMLSFNGLVIILALLSCCSSMVIAEQEFADNSAVIQLLANAPENSWVRLNANQYQDVWTPFQQRALPHNQNVFLAGTPHSVIEAWSSMAWDSNRGNLIFWGGGHANYTGNEVYLWSANTLNWQRASLPSAIKQVDPKLNINWFETVGGVFDAPISSHTYDNSEFLPIADRFITFGGASYTLASAFIHSDNINRNTGPYLWNPALAGANKTGGKAGTQVNASAFPNVAGGKMWQNRDNLPQPFPNIRSEVLEETSAYTQINGKDVILFTHQQQLIQYTIIDITNPFIDTYRVVGESDGFRYSGQGAGAFDADRNIYVRSAGDDLVYWDLNESAPVSFPANVNNPDEFDFSRLVDYGMDFDPVRKIFLLWGGDSEVWTLTTPDNLTTAWQLNKLSDGSSSQHAPEFSHLNGLVGVFPLKFSGILGKWKYIRALDVFIGVADPLTGDIWAYKPENWSRSNNLPPQLSPPGISCDTLVCGSRTGTVQMGSNITTQEFMMPLPETPVIITGIPTTNGTQPGVIQVRNVTNSNFQIQFKEWNYLDLFHLQESAGYIALLPGTYQLEDGGVLEVGSFQISDTGNWQSIELANSFDDNPSVFLTIQTMNGGDTVTPRIRNISDHSFEVALFEQESLMHSDHLLENVGYLAIYSPDKTGLMSVSSQSLSYSLTNLNLGLQPQTVFGQTIYLQEEQSADDETLHHASETVLLMQLGDSLFGQIASNIGFDTISLHR